MPDNDAMSFIFGGNTGLTVEQLRRRQAVAAAVASQKRAFPKTFGEGLTYLGESIGDRLTEERLRASENELQARNEKMAADGRAVKPTYGTEAAPARSVAPSRVTPTVAPQSGVPGGNYGDRGPDDYSYMLPQTTGFNAAPDMAVQTAINRFEPDETMRGYLGQLSSKEQPVPGQTSPTGAAGPFQFTRGTGDQYGLMNGGDQRGDAVASVQAVRQLTGDNINAFRQTNGRDPTLPELAILHQQGAGGGSALINGRIASPDNLRVNNVDPAAGASEAVRKLKGFYGMPDQPIPEGYGGPPKTVRDKIVEAIQGQGNNDVPQGVAQTNPTVPGEATPPVTGGQPDQPTRLASLDTGTMSDAPPIGRAMPSVPVDPAVEENPPTPTSIAPAPQVAQAGGGTTMMPSGSYGPAPAQSPALAPLQLPPAQTMEPPGAAPEVPKPLPLSQSQQKWLNIMNSPYAGDNLKAIAKQQFDFEEKHRTDLQTQREQDYVHQRGRFETKQDAYEKFNREAADHRFKQQADFLAANKTQAELEKMLYEAGEPRTQAAIKAALDIQKQRVDISQAERTLAKPDEHVINGVILQRVPGSDTYKPAPGSPTDDKLTEKQMQTLKYLQRAVVAQSLVGDGTVLRGLKDTALGKVPMAGNYGISEEYQSKHGAAMTWISNVLRDESGAAISPSEYANKFKQYFPQPGDSDKIVSEKAARRQAEERSLYESMGDKKKLMDDWYASRKALRTDKPEGTVEYSNKGRMRRVIGGHWVTPDEY